MKDLYSIVESILDADFADTATEQVKEIKKHGNAAIYNMSLVAQYVADELHKLYGREWVKTSKKVKLGRISIDEYVCTMPASQYESSEVSYNKIWEVLETALHLPNLIQLPEDDFYMNAEDYVDDKTGNVIPCIRIYYKDGARKYRTWHAFSFNEVDEHTIQLAIYGKFLKI